MKSLASVLTGLLSSLFLSLGFRQLAARLDPLHHCAADTDFANDAQNLSAVACSPCRLQGI